MGKCLAGVVCIEVDLKMDAQCCNELIHCRQSASSSPSIAYRLIYMSFRYCRIRCRCRRRRRRWQHTYSLFL